MRQADRIQAERGYMEANMLRILLLIVALAFPLPAYAWPGTVLDVHDGDTMTVARWATSGRR